MLTPYPGGGPSCHALASFLVSDLHSWDNAMTVIVRYPTFEVTSPASAIASNSGETYFISHHEAMSIGLPNIVAVIKMIFQLSRTLVSRNIAATTRCMTIVPNRCAWVMPANLPIFM